jgi:hypothetical protein
MAWIIDLYRARRMRASSVANGSLPARAVAMMSQLSAPHG